MSASGAAVQKALYAALSGDAALTATVTGVFDGVRPDAALPYLTIGPDVAVDAGGKTEAGREHRVQVTAWDAGPGVAGAKRLLGLAENALTGVPAEVDGWRIVSARFVRSFVTAEVDGATRGVMEVRVRTAR